MFRRAVLSFLVPCLIAAADGTHAQTFPSRPVKIVLPQPAGAGPDAMARALADTLSRNLGQPVVVENRPGANGALAASYVIGQPADGHTLFLAGVSTMAWNPYLYKQLNYNATRDLVGVALLANTRFITVAAPSLGVTTLPALIAKAKAAPGRIDFASVGVGNSSHLATELLMQRTGIRMQHVPFGGATGATFYTSLMSGDTPVMTSVPSDLIPLAKAGKVVALAVTGDTRMPQLPEVPTFKELGIDMDVPGWYALVARAGTSPAHIERLHAAVEKALDAPNMRELLAVQVLEPIKAPASEVERLTRRDSETWGPFISGLNIAK